MAQRSAGPDHEAARLRVRLLGDLEVRRDGDALPLPPSRRTRALLGFLVAQGVPQSRTTLCDLLWDGPDDPRASLRWSLTKLRAVVNDETIERLHADRAKVGFEARDCDVDATRVVALLGAGTDVGALPIHTLEEAAHALRGEFLDGLELPACYRFHHWCMAERERFARLRRSVLEALTARLADDPQRALPHARVLVAADPLDEAAHATLVRVLAAAGRYPDAEQHYDWARELLQREIALPAGGPLDEVIRAARRRQRVLAAASSSIAAGHGAAPASDGVPAAPYLPVGAVAALVGRDPECQAIEAALVAPRDAPVVCIVGEPGIGKTRLLDHVAERAGALGLRVLRARCFEGESLRPYGFWLDALRGVTTTDVSPPVLERIAPLLGGATGAVTREQMIEASVELLAVLARSHPLAVIVDDLQWIDDASVALLHFAARRLADRREPVLFVAAARTGEIDDNPGAMRMLQSLARERPLLELGLRPLREDDVRQWLGDRLADVGEAMRASGGNPLFLVELAHAADASGTPAGRPLATLIEDRLRVLGEASRDLLGWAAALGGEFGADRLAAASALPVATVLGHLARFERHGLVRPAGGGGFDFAHDLVREAIYRALSTPRRRALHRQIAHAFAAASADDPWLHGAVVHHAALAGDVLLATRAALAAGEHWMRVFANVEAAQVAERGLALLESLVAGVERVRLEIGLLRLRVAAASAPGGRRLPDLTGRIRSVVDAAQSLALHGVASSGWEILAYWCQQMGDSPGAQSATLAAERCARLADAATRCQQLANSGRCLIDIEADGERGRALLADAAALADELQLPMMELEWGRGLVARADGDLDGARVALERAVALARAAINYWREYECMLALAIVEYELGHYDAVLQHVGEIAEAARRMGETQVPFADALAALSRRRIGAPGAADAVAASLAALRERDAKVHLGYALNEAAALALDAGGATEALRLANEALGAAVAMRRPSQIARARAILAAAAPAAALHS